MILIVKSGIALEVRGVWLHNELEAFALMITFAQPPVPLITFPTYTSGAALKVSGKVKLIDVLLLLPGAYLPILFN